jgi:hypothetical protein
MTETVKPKKGSRNGTTAAGRKRLLTSAAKRNWNRQQNAVRQLCFVWLKNNKPRLLLKLKAQAKRRLAKTKAGVRRG